MNKKKTKDVKVETHSLESFQSIMRHPRRYGIGLNNREQETRVWSSDEDNPPSFPHQPPQSSTEEAEGSSEAS